MSNNTNAPENVQEPQNEAQQEQPQDEPKDALGDAGKKDLDAERKRANEAEKRFKEAAARIEEFENAQRTEEEKRERELNTLRALIEEERKQREAVERNFLIKSVAMEFGLPDDLGNRLVAVPAALLAVAPEHSQAVRYCHQTWLISRSEEHTSELQSH